METPHNSPEAPTPSEGEPSPAPSKKPNEGGRGRKILGALLVCVIILVVGLLIYAVSHMSHTNKPEPAKVIATPTPVAAVKTSDVQVTISKDGFMPTSLRFKAGSQVTWTNTDTAAHSLTSPQLEDLVSDSLAPKDSYSFTFEKQGTYTINSNDVTMTVTVVE